MTAMLGQTILLPEGRLLYVSSKGTRHHLAELLARVRQSGIGGYVTVDTQTWAGTLLILRGQPICAFAGHDVAGISRYDRDAYEQLCHVADDHPTTALSLHQLEESHAQALTALFAPPSLTTSVGKGASLRIVLEVVAGCRFHGCLLFEAGADRAVVILQDGLPLGAYDSRTRHLQATLAAPLGSVLGKADAHVAFLPRRARELAALPTVEQIVSLPALLTHPPALPADVGTLLAADEPARDSLQPDTPADAEGLPSAEPARSTSDAAPTGSSVAAMPGTADALRDDLVESNTVWLLSALDRQWVSLKQKGLGQPAMLTVLAAMITLTASRAEAVRTQRADAGADPTGLAALVNRTRGRYPVIAALSVHGARIDATPLVMHARMLKQATGIHEWLAACSGALLACLREACRDLILLAPSHATRERLHEVCNVCLDDMDEEIEKMQQTALAVSV